MRSLWLVPVVIMASVSASKAEQVGDPQAGFAYAKDVCAACHGIAGEPSPIFEATSFQEIADTPGMTGTALAAWLQTSHPTMPNIILEKQDMWNVIAYILDLKGRGQN